MSSIQTAKRPVNYAVVQLGGSQYRVEEGQHLKVSKMNQEPGHQFQIEKVLAIGGESSLFGHPFIEQAKVDVTIQRQVLGPKILVFKKQRRKRHRRMKGHRQAFTEIKINKIISPLAT